MKRLNQKETQERLLNIGKEFHRICERHGIPYYMLGGTMLGAIRHKGFIPWDDDMDFGVERKYFAKLVDLIRSESSYKLSDRYNSDIIFYDFDKMEDGRVLIEDPTVEHIVKNRNLYIDIFPLDKTNGGKGFLSSNYWVHKIGVLNVFRYTNLRNMRYGKRIFLSFLRFLLKPLSRNCLIDFANRFLIKGRGNYVSNLYGFWGTRETVEEQVMGTPQLYQFEDTCFYGPQDYDSYLTSLYGDYMKLPPENERHIHTNRVYEIENTDR